jgi:hypothetical protein
MYSGVRIRGLTTTGTSVLCSCGAYDTYRPLRIILPTFTRYDTPTKEGSWTKLITPDDVHETKYLQKLSQMPEWWHIAYSLPTNNVDAKYTAVPVDQMVKMIDHLAWTNFGCVRTRDIMNLAPRHFVEHSKIQRSHLSGPCGGRDLSRTLASFGRFRPPQSVSSSYTYCKFGEDIFKKNETAHCCTIYLKLQICSRMLWTADDRLVCVVHFRDGPPAPKSYPASRTPES